MSKRSNSGESRRSRKQTDKGTAAVAVPEQLMHRGKPLRVLSTSLGLVLAANLLLASEAMGDTAQASGSDQPKLVEWSTDAVKKYFDPNVDWNIPYPIDNKNQGQAGASANAGSAAAGGAGGGTNTVIVRQGGGFGWDDLLLYHLLFNSGRSYSTSAWDSSRPVYDSRTNQPYKPQSFDSETFRNKPTAGSTVRPKTSSSSGTFTTRSGASSSRVSSSTKSSSSSPGSIGSRSGGFSSSSSHSSGGSFGS